MLQLIDQVLRTHLLLTHLDLGQPIYSLMVWTLEDFLRMREQVLRQEPWVAKRRLAVA